MISVITLVSVMVMFEPPTEYEDGSVLPNSEITEYSYEIYSNTEPPKTGTFTNIGQTSFTVDLNVGWYAMCMFAKAGQWSNMRCTIDEVTNPPKPVALCK